MTEFSIEEYKAKAIRIYFRPEELITLYSYSVTVPYAFFAACLFRQECIIVDLDVFDSFYNLLNDLMIVPITNPDLNGEYFDRIKNVTE